MMIAGIDAATRRTLLPNLLLRVRGQQTASASASAWATATTQGCTTECSTHRLSRQSPPPTRSPVLEVRRGMAGHSKWANIRHKKGAKDKARAAILGKASMGIMAASKACGGDMSNLRLQSAIQHAKAVQLPKDRVEDAIAKGTVKTSDSADVFTLRFDAMLNLEGTKVACIVTALSDNRNRTTQNVRHLVSKDGSGELLATGSLAYIFGHVGQIVVERVADEDTLLDCALEAGAVNVEQDEEDLESFLVTTEDTDLFRVVTSLRESSYEVTQFEHRYILQDQDHGGAQLPSEGEDALVDFLDKMDENEDVTNVFHNAI